MERGGTAPPGDLGCAVMELPEGWLSKGRTLKRTGRQNIIFGKNNCRQSQEERYPSSLGSAVCSSGKSSLTPHVRIWLFCWTPIKQHVSPSLPNQARTLLCLCPTPTFLSAPTIPSYDLCYPLFPPYPLPSPHPVCVCPFHSRFSACSPQSNCTPPCSQLSACFPHTLTGLLSHPLTVS